MPRYCYPGAEFQTEERYKIRCLPGGDAYAIVGGTMRHLSSVPVRDGVLVEGLPDPNDPLAAGPHYLFQRDGTVFKGGEITDIRNRFRHKDKYKSNTEAITEHYAPLIERLKKE